ncbi:MAG: chorismate synthase, partial [Firmicutes bacterium]|nr:chorismate synthase [Bacillota bacterium]
GGVIECRVKGLPAGVGEPVFDKLDASLGRAIFSIGAVKGVEFGIGFEAAKIYGSQNNDNFYAENGVIKKKTNNSGGILGGISDGSELILRAAFKPTPSIAQPQQTVNNKNENIEIEIKGRHDPIVVPRAVVVVEAMTAITLVDLLLMNMSAKIENVKKIYNK